MSQHILELGSRLDFCTLLAALSVQTAQTLLDSAQHNCACSVHNCVAACRMIFIPGFQTDSTSSSADSLLLATPPHAVPPTHLGGDGAVFSLLQCPGTPNRSQFLHLKDTSYNVHKSGSACRMIFMVEFPSCRRIKLSTQLAASHASTCCATNSAMLARIVARNPENGGRRVPEDDASDPKIPDGAHARGTGGRRYTTSLAGVIDACAPTHKTKPFIICPCSCSLDAA
jgi:hypothetical protein